MQHDTEPMKHALPSSGAKVSRTQVAALLGLALGVVIGAGGHAWWAQPGAAAVMPVASTAPAASAVLAVTTPPAGEVDWALQARTDASQGRFKEALPAFTQAEARGQADAQLYADHAEALGYVQASKPDAEHAGLLAKALAIDPNNVKALVLAGTAALQNQAYGPASELLSRAVQHVPVEQVELKKLIESRLIEARRAQSSAQIKSVPTTAP